MADGTTTGALLRVIICDTQADADAIRSAGFRSVYVIDHVGGLYRSENGEMVIDPALAIYDHFVLAFRNGLEEFRDAFAMRLDDTKCRWVRWAVETPSAATLMLECGRDSVKAAIDGARPMWTDEICLLSDIPEAPEIETYKSGFRLLDDHGFRLVRPAFMPVIGPYGPLPGSAEYHTTDGWKRLDQWSPGDMALVCDPTTGATKYEAVGRVVSDAPDGFMRLRNDTTIDITACANHRWPVVGKSGKHRVMTTSEIAQRGVRDGGEGSGYSLIRTFDAPDLPDLPMSDAHIRLAVAVCADGCIRDKMASRRICVCIRKQRKRDRIEMLLGDACVEFRVRNYEGRPTEFHYDFDFAENKSLTQFRNASPRQLRVVFDELRHWDGHVYETVGDGRLVMSTSNPDDAAFLEYLYSACGYRASVFTQNGNPETQRDNHLIAANVRGRQGRIRWTSVDRGVVSVDGKKYCLTTTTGFFVCRLCPGQVYVTGNSGKSILLRQLCCNALRMHGWRTLITSFEERVKPRYVRDLRRHLIGGEITNVRTGEVSWEPKHQSEWTSADVSGADAEIERGFRFLRRKRNTTLDVERLVDRIEYAVRVYGLEVVVIDPINEIDHQVGKSESKTDYMGRFIMRLKALADDYNLLMIVCAHPPKDGVEKRMQKGKLLTLNDGADTAHYGNKADIGWCVWRPGLDENSPTFLNIDKLKDHEVMGQPTIAKLVLDKRYGRLVVTQVGPDVLAET